MVPPPNHAPRRGSLSARVRLLAPHEVAPSLPVSIDAVVGHTAADHLDIPAASAPDPAKSAAPVESDFAVALRLRMEEARRRFDAEHLHLDHVETAALDYLRSTRGEPV
jgi:hypothetical protein